MEPIDAPILSDGVVVLGVHELDDAPLMVAGEDEEMARRFGWFPRRSSLEDAMSAILRWRESWRQGGEERAFAVRVAERLVGQCELRRGEQGRANVSWSIFAADRRRGYGVRAVKLVADWALAQGFAERLEAYVAPDNQASLRLAKSAGFREEGRLRAWARGAAGREDMILLARIAGDDAS